MNKYKVVVVGNCQARPIADLLVKMSTEIEVIKVAIVHLLNSDQEDEYLPFFEDADFIITQLIQSNYPCDFVRTNVLKEKYNDKVVTIINLFFSGYTPDWIYVRLPGKGTLKGPMGDYHNKTIMECWSAGMSVQKTAEVLSDVEFNSSRYSDTVLKSLAELNKREKFVDVKICDFINDNYLSKRLFFTFNHPTLELLVEYAQRIIKFLSLSISCNQPMIREPLDQIILLLNRGVGFFLPLETEYKGFEVEEFSPNIVLGKSKKYAAHELVEQFFNLYSVNSEILHHIENENI
jgi:hypothetical protein